MSCRSWFIHKYSVFLYPFIFVIFLYIKNMKSDFYFTKKGLKNGCCGTVEKEQLIQLSWSTSHVGSQLCVLDSWCYNLIRVAWASLDNVE